MFKLKKISEDEAIILLKEEEGHFFDFTSKDYSGQTVQKKCVAFANADGGELLIGILDKKDKNLKGGKFERWVGFNEQEEANDVIADIIKNIKPSIENINFEFLEIDANEHLGKTLSVTIEKSITAHETASGNTYLRRGAQCLMLNQEEIINLKLSKGVKSYENQSVPEYKIERLIASEELEKFLNFYMPKTDSKEFLEKQNLINEQENPIYAGILLYDKCPSALLPRKCAVKITRYDTNEEEPEREHMKESKTIEGPLNEQIKESVQEIQRIINTVPIMGPSGLEQAKYPPEAIKEILVNAIIHRDYNMSDDVSIFIFNNRIEVHSPGALPAHITPENILTERFSRNPKIVRLLNKYPDRPNHDIGEGLNTAFQKMKEVRLKAPKIENSKTRVVVTLPHETLASPEEQVLKYLETHEEITNPIARRMTGIKSENRMKASFYKLRDKNYLERVPNKKGSKSAWRRVMINEKVAITAEEEKLPTEQLEMF